MSQIYLEEFGKNREELLRKLIEEPQFIDNSVDDEPHESNPPSASDQQSTRDNQLPENFKENTTNIFDEMEHGEVIRSIGSHLYQDFKDRVQRQKMIQENLEKERIRKMNESKVNQKSQKMYIKKISKDIKEVLDFVDDQATSLITFNGLGYVLFFLDVFKVQYNEEYLNKLSQKSGKTFNKEMVNEQSLNHFQVISFVTLKNEERRLQEEMFHHKLWKLLNPYESDYVEREILNEFLKLMFDPYTPLEKLVPIVKDFIEIIRKAKKMNLAELGNNNDDGHDRAPTMKAILGVEEANNSDSKNDSKGGFSLSKFKTPENRNFVFSTEGSQISTDNLDVVIEDILNHFKFLYDYQGGNRKIKIPSYKKQKAFYEVYKECTFKPALNKKSLGMGQNRKPLTEQSHKKEEPGMIVKSTNYKSNGNIRSKIPLSPKSSDLAGKIVPKGLAKQLSNVTTEARVEKQHRDKSPNLIHKRLYELHNLDRQKRDKNEAIRQENIRKEEEKCTFHPKISKGSSKMTQRPLTAQDAISKLRKKKRMQSPTIFEKLYEDSKKEPPREKTRQQIEDEKYFEECTFKPDIR